MNWLKFINTVTITTLMATRVASEEWATLLERHKQSMDPQTYSLITRQHRAFSEGSAPVIADQRVKSIAISECNEPVVDMYVAKHPRIRVMEGDMLLKAHKCPEDIDPRAEKHGCMRTGVFDALARMLVVLDELAPSFGYKSGELEIHLFEGLRDIATQKQLFDTLLDKIKRENPHMTHEEAYAQTSKFVSPYLNNVPVHSTGGAIDIHLWSNKKHAYLNMGRFNSSKDGSATFTEHLSDQQKLHRLLMLIAATHAGLTNYVYEFWHFSYGDRYACYWRGTDCALYGSV